MALGTFSLHILPPAFVALCSLPSPHAALASPRWTVSRHRRWKLLLPSPELTMTRLCLDGPCLLPVSQIGKASSPQPHTHTSSFSSTLLICNLNISNNHHSLLSPVIETFYWPLSFWFFEFHFFINLWYKCLCKGIQVSHCTNLVWNPLHGFLPCEALISKSI